MVLVFPRYTVRPSDPIYGFWFFEAYYESFGKQLSLISTKFKPETDSLTPSSIRSNRFIVSLRASVRT